MKSLLGAPSMNLLLNKKTSLKKINKVPKLIRNPFFFWSIYLKFSIKFYCNNFKKNLWINYANDSEYNVMNYVKKNYFKKISLKIKKFYFKATDYSKLPFNLKTNFLNEFYFNKLSLFDNFKTLLLIKSNKESESNLLNVDKKKPFNRYRIFSFWKIRKIKKFVPMKRINFFHAKNMLIDLLPIKTFYRRMETKFQHTIEWKKFNKFLKTK